MESSAQTKRHHLGSEIAQSGELKDWLQRSDQAPSLWLLDCPEWKTKSQHQQEGRAHSHFVPLFSSILPEKNTLFIL